MKMDKRNRTNLKWYSARSLKKEVRGNYQLYLMIAPPLVWLVIFMYVPMYGVQIAFKNFRAVDGIGGSEWAGLKYFEKFFRSYDSLQIVLNTLEVCFYTLLAGFPLFVLLALLLNNTNRNRFRRWVQMSTFAPYFISVTVVVGMLVQFLSVQDYGIINNIIRFFGGEPIMFMTKPEWFSSVYAWSNIWQGAGFNAIIYIAALAGIDQELYEAAVVDGASKFRRMLHIDLPGIMPTVVITFILAVGQVMNLGFFDKIFLMQNPLNLDRSEVISTYVYKTGLASSLPNYSYAAAVGLFNTMINLVLLLLANRISRKVNQTSLW
ncbi:ABC transporter permease [Cohnella phaseoli]|uniref:Putative aldouronate transport system permease protein n=1 Tax=Cohnella phaseoli TaxID=456490 RepID=A0A3D9KGH5_9BACL|nr:ABC transporter permease subunit [Cohnella phaseoli]RED85390.1 putative aldouronate transport system permease protein [Cohnella phaseoli]